VFEKAISQCRLDDAEAQNRISLAVLNL
jgi:hypothetical protein